jgi:hypothetical protein
MIRKASEIRELFQDKFEVLKQPNTIWLTDRRYYCPPRELVLDIFSRIVENRKDWLRVRGDHWDCDDIALMVHFYFKHIWANSDIGEIKGVRYPVAFGQAIGTVWNGWEDVHEANVAVTPEGILLLDAQTADNWYANPPPDDDIFLIKAM